MPTERDKPARKKTSSKSAGIVGRFDRTTALQLAELRRLGRVKYEAPVEVGKLGPAMIGFFKQSVEKRQSKLVKIADCFARMVPASLAEHCAIDSFSRGTLTVVVDTASHLFDMKTLLLAGLQEQLKVACKTTGLVKVNLRPGRWYDGDGQNRRIEF